MWKLSTAPDRNDEKKRKMWCADWSHKKQLLKGEQSVTSIYIMKDSVSGFQGELKEDKMPAWQRTPPCCRLHILSPAREAAWLCPQKPSVTHRLYGMLLQAFACMFNCVWKLFSLTLCLLLCHCPYSCFHRCFCAFILSFFLYSIHSDSWIVKEGWITMLPLYGCNLDYSSLSPGWFPPLEFGRILRLVFTFRYQVQFKCVMLLKEK